MERDITVHQAWLWFAFNTITREGCWAHDYYRDKQKTGTNHYTTLRCIAKRWVMVVYRMWHNRTLYDEQHHQSRRRDRGAVMV